MKTMRHESKKKRDGKVDETNANNWFTSAGTARAEFERFQEVSKRGLTRTSASSTFNDTAQGDGGYRGHLEKLKVQLKDPRNVTKRLPVSIGVPTSRLHQHWKFNATMYVNISDSDSPRT